MHSFEPDTKLPTRCIECGQSKSTHPVERWCVYSPEGQPLPDPIGDSAEDAIRCFCALSEMSRQYFDDFGYTVGPAPSVH